MQAGFWSLPFTPELFKILEDLGRGSIRMQIQKYVAGADVKM